MPLTTSHIEDIFTSREEDVKRLLSNIFHLNLQHESNEKYIISTINRLLSTAKHRQEGLEYLNLVIDNCSPSVVAHNALNWIGHCIIRFPDDVLRELKLRVLGELIKVAHSESEFNKKFVSDYISKVLDNCTTTSYVNPYECKAALKTLTIAMQYYASRFGAHRQKIENFVLSFLDSKNADLVQSAALAFHFLQQIGSAGSNGVNHKLNFGQNFHKLCRTVHKLYDIFFENEKEIFHTVISNEDNVFEFQDDPSNNSQVLLHINARRIKNIFTFIETMIKTKFPVAKETKPKDLLEVITRGTSIHKCISGDSIESLETYQFSFLLSEIQCAVLKLLRLFIIWYQANCLPFSYSISKILVDSIERSHSCECFKYDSLYQECTYRALSDWLSISKSSLHPQFQSQILTSLLKDVTPIKTQITLTISEKMAGKKSQRAKRRAMAERIISSGDQSLSDSSTYYEKISERNTCKFALTALRHLLEFTTLNVKSTLLKDLYKSIFDSLTSIQSSKPLHPYTDAQCQVKLYEILVAIYNQNTLSILPPLQTSLGILTRGANDSNRFVSEICQSGLRNLEILCQPICPSLYLGLEKDGEEMEGEGSVREVIEIQEMDVDEEGVGDGASSVDYDASTDEFSPSRKNSTATSSFYNVNQPGTESFIHDGVSDEDPSADEFYSEKSAKRDGNADNLKYEVNQPDPDVAGDKDDNKVGMIEEHDATSQKGGEIDAGPSTAFSDVRSEVEEDQLQELEASEKNQLDISSSFQQEENQESILLEELRDQNKSDQENSTKEVHIVSLEEPVEKIEGKEFTRNEECEVVNSNTEYKDWEQKSEITETESKQEHPEVSKVDINDEQHGAAGLADLPIHREEPPAKKVKFTSEHDDLGIELEEKTGKEEQADLDPIDPEDDSFVDEIQSCKQCSTISDIETCHAVEKLQEFLSHYRELADLPWSQRTREATLRTYSRMEKSSAATKTAMVQKRRDLLRRHPFLLEASGPSKVLKRKRIGADLQLCNPDKIKIVKI